jgi:hypothetical protein
MAVIMTRDSIYDMSTFNDSIYDMSTFNGRNYDMSQQ